MRSACFLSLDSSQGFWHREACHAQYLVYIGCKSISISIRGSGERTIDVGRGCPWRMVLQQLQLLYLCLIAFHALESHSDMVPDFLHDDAAHRRGRCSLLLMEKTLPYLPRSVHSSDIAPGARCPTKLKMILLLILLSKKSIAHTITRLYLISISSSSTLYITSGMFALEQMQ